MKKFFLIFIGIVLTVVAVLGFNAYSGGALVQNIENLVPTQSETETTQFQNQKVSTNGKKTLSEQLLDTLSEDEKAAYEIIYSAMSSRKDSIRIPQKLDAQRIFELVQLVIAQHPEIFWSKGDCTFASNKILTFKYSYTNEEIEEKNSLIEKRTKEIFNEINPAGSEYEKSLAIFDYIVKNTTYAHDAVNDMENHIEVSTIEGVFLNSRAVCSGYAKAYQYLLSLADVDAITVSGTAQTPNGEGEHAWVAQVVDGENYFTDATWGDSCESFTNGDFVSHTYFLMSSDDIEKTHKCSSLYDFIKGSDKENNYFIKEKLYFEKYNQPDIRTAIKNSLEKKQKGIELKFASDEEYKKAQTVLFDNENIYLILLSIDLLSNNFENDTISYNCDDTHNIITIFYKYKEN